MEDYGLLCRTIEESGVEITVVLSGRAKGVDALGERWARENNIPVECHPAKWKDLSHPDAIIVEEKGMKYDKKAGIRRNEKMVRDADALIALIRNDSKGTRHIIQCAQKNGLHCHVVEVD